MQAEELDRVELHLGGRGSLTGFLRTPDGVAPLPIGSTLNATTGEFDWAPGPGFIGGYNLVFVRWNGGTPVSREDVRVVLNPKGSNRVGPQTIIDLPTANQTIRAGAAFRVTGWAADLDAPDGDGVSAVHVWAYPVGTSNSAPAFLGAAGLGGARPDVAAIYGDRFLDTGYGIIVNGLAPGTYDLAVFAFSTAANDFTAARVVRVTVR